MMSESDIRQQIIKLLEDRPYHAPDTIRGMVWAITGNDPGRLNTSIQVFKALNIPHRVVEHGNVEWGTLVDPNFEL